MNSYQNKKRKRNLVKKNSKKLYFKLRHTQWLMSIEYKKLFDIMFEERLLFGIIPKVMDNLPQFSLTEEQLEILKKRATN